METVKPGWPATGWQWVRFVGNYVNLSTILGLGVAKLGRATIRRGPRGLYLGEGYHFKFPVAGAFTIGLLIPKVLDAIGTKDVSPSARTQDDPPATSSEARMSTREK